MRQERTVFLHFGSNTFNGVEWRTGCEDPAIFNPTALDANQAYDRLTVETIDAQGRVVPVANNKITFTLTGPAKLIGVGNGDPGYQEPD